MKRYTRIAAAGTCCLLAGALPACGSGDGGYHVGLVMPDASGLRDGAQVALGGVGVGRVKLRLAPDHRRVLVDLMIDREHAPLDRGVRVAISSVNLLGLKRADLIPPATPQGPAASGSRLAASRVVASTDLDQVLDVLDPDTRTALAVVVNEAGAGAAGRGTDMARLLEAFPKSLVEVTRLVDQVAGDNRTLKQLLARSDGFIGQVTARRRQLSRLIRVAAGTGTTVAARHAELRSALRRAPATLTALRGFLDELRGTAASLGPAARDISAVTPALAATLDEVEPFQRAAAPTLRRATAVAPPLTALARKGGPVIERTAPVAATLADTARKLIPVSATLDDSADNILAVIENWSRAIQFRDGLSHVFRGEASVTPNLLTGYVDRLLHASAAPALPARKALTQTVPRRPAPPATATAAKPAPVPAPGRDPIAPVVKNVTAAVEGVLDGVRGTTPKDGGDSAGIGSLLDFLLKP